MPPYEKEFARTQREKVSKVAGTTKDYSFAPERAKRIIGSEGNSQPGAQTQNTPIDSGPTTQKDK